MAGEYVGTSGANEAGHPCLGSSTSATQEKKIISTKIQAAGWTWAGRGQKNVPMWRGSGLDRGMDDEIQQCQREQQLAGNQPPFYFPLPL